MPLNTPSAALRRAQKLLSILDREHTHEALYEALRGVRHEVETARRLLSGEPQPGMPRRPNLSRRGSARHRLLEHVARAGPGGVTDVEMARALGGELRVLRTRRSELRASGFLRPRTNQWGVTVKAAPRGMPGNRATLWVVTEAGRRMLDKLATGQHALPLEVDRGEEGRCDVPERAPVESAG